MRPAVRVRKIARRWRPSRGAGERADLHGSYVHACLYPRPAPGLRSRDGPATNDGSAPMPSQASCCSSRPHRGPVAAVRGPAPGRCGHRLLPYRSLLPRERRERGFLGTAGDSGSGSLAAATARSAAVAARGAARCSWSSTLPAGRGPVPSGRRDAITAVVQHSTAPPGSLGQPPRGQQGMQHSATSSRTAHDGLWARAPFPVRPQRLSAAPAPLQATPRPGRSPSRAAFTTAGETEIPGVEGPRGNQCL